MLFRLNTVGLENVRLSFDWRTDLAWSTDRFVAGYYTGELQFDGDRLRDFHNQGPAWSNWSQIVRQRSHDWQSVSDFLLPSGEDHLWIAFWLDDGATDYGKIDNIMVQAEGEPIPTDPVPEPGSVALMLIGLGSLALFSRNLRRRLGSTVMRSSES